MEYSLWNLPTGFWQAGGQANIPTESAARQSYYTPSTNSVPAFHPGLNAIGSTPSFRPPGDYLPPKNVLGPRSVVSLIEDKNQLDGAVSMAGDLLEQRSIDSLRNEAHSMEQDDLLDEHKYRPKRELSPNYDQCNDSNGGNYMKQENNFSYQQAMYGLLMNQMACKQNGADPDDDDQKCSILANSTESRSSSTGDDPTAGCFECGHCGFVAETRLVLKKHITEAHPDCQTSLLEKPSSVPNPCPMVSCRFKTEDRSELEAHVTKHVTETFPPGSKKKGCPVALQRVRYEREEYRCQLCAYSCTIEKAFYKHLKVHSLGQPAPVIKISCVICGKDRISEIDMTKHMKKHRDDRFFCCDICIFKTVQLKKLIQHRRMHTGEKPHLCPHCSYRSARRDNLRSHVRRVHKKQNLYCDTFSPRGILVSASATNQETNPDSNQPE